MTSIKCPETRYRIGWRAFAATVKQACAELETPLSRLASEIDVAPSGLSRFLAHDIGLSVEMMLGLCAHLGINPMDFVAEHDGAEVETPRVISLADMRVALAKLHERVESLEAATK